MQIEKVISTVDTHTAGEPTRIVTGGIPHIPGKTMMEKKLWLQSNMDRVRKLLMHEPRGHKDMFGAIITAPASEGADAGVIFMDSKGYLDMCGHGSIGSVTVLLNTGMIPLDRGVSSREVVIDTPAGKVTAHAPIENGAATEVRICNVPSFLYDELDVDIEQVGRVHVKVSYGGNYFALVDAKEIGIPLEMSNIDILTSIGIKIRDMVNAKITVVHPATGEKGEVSLTEIYEERRYNGGKSDAGCDADCRNLVIFGNGQIDRSPCGTGTCAKMAYLYEKGALGIGDSYFHASIIDTVFRGRILAETEVGNRKGILPEITGRAHITGFHQFVVEEQDPFKEGFSLGV